MSVVVYQVCLPILVYVKCFGTDYRGQWAVYEMRLPFDRLTLSVSEPITEGNGHFVDSVENNLMLTKNGKHIS